MMKFEVYWTEWLNSVHDNFHHTDSAVKLLRLLDIQKNAQEYKNGDCFAMLIDGQLFSLNRGVDTYVKRWA